MKKLLPTFNYEQELWGKGCNWIAGVDEVGRGCFAGPVVAAAVIFPKNFSGIEGVNDSKLLSPVRREKLTKEIKEKALAYAIAEVSVQIINELGIGKATQKAFQKAVQDLQVNSDYILIDAFYMDGFSKHKQKPIIHGDRKSISIAAASIIAKVYRDQRMRELHQQFEVYDFFTNKGYGTKKHREAIKKYGLSDLHRKSFNLTKFL